MTPWVIAWVIAWMLPVTSPALSSENSVSLKESMPLMQDAVNGMLLYFLGDRHVHTHNQQMMGR
jgi:hypothetical protein